MTPSQPFRFAHIADLHHSERMLLGGELVLDPETGINVRLADAQRCMAAFIQQARAFGARLTIIAGDVYDRCKPTPNEERAAMHSIDALAELGPVVLIPGNHDHPGTPSDATAVESLRNRPNVHVADRPGVFDVFADDSVYFTALESASRAAPPSALARVFALPWPARSALLADAAGASAQADDRNAEISRRLALLVQAMRTLRTPGIPNLLVFHGTIAEATVNEQPAALQQDIGLRVADLSGWDYVALGHIHQRQSFALEDGAVAWYPGSIERLGFGEEHEEKGGNLVELASVARGFESRVTFARTPARLYQTLSAADELTALGDPHTIYRIQGEVTDAERANVMSRVTDSGARHVVFDLAVKRDARIRDPELRQDMSEEALIQRRLEARGLPAERVARVVEIHRQIARSAQP